ncbi:hypothetical protein MMC25_006313 [Agyrium rufum]|nr:hypothetical protein [Agyrium rufum]
MSDYFQVTYLCDVSEDAMAHCARKIPGPSPRLSSKHEDLCSSPEVDVVLVASSDAFHQAHALAGLEAGKVVFVEKPMAMSLKDADALIASEKNHGGRIMVGYMRRYAPALLDAIEEIGGVENVLYARVRDILNEKSVFVGQSGTFPKTFSDIKPESLVESRQRSDAKLNQALDTELSILVTPITSLQWRLLGGLGSHDLSCMREALGMPTKCLGAAMCVADSPPFWSALFQYPKFTVSYESGIDSVPRFDASVEIFSKNKTVKVVYDTPYVKGLPTTMHVRESGPDGSARDTIVRKTYEDNYTLEMKELYEIVVNGKKIKTSATDAKQDLELFGMFMKAAVARQAATE